MNDDRILIKKKVGINGILFCVNGLVTKSIIYFVRRLANFCLGNVYQISPSVPHIANSKVIIPGIKNSIVSHHGQITFEIYAASDMMLPLHSFINTPPPSYHALPSRSLSKLC